MLRNLTSYVFVAPTSIFWQYVDAIEATSINGDFGAQDRYNKKTGLWCSNGANMPLGITGDNAPLGDANPCHLKLGGKSARTKYIRSLTPRGMAIAIYQANKFTLHTFRALAQCNLAL